MKELQFLPDTVSEQHNMVKKTKHVAFIFKIIMIAMWFTTREEYYFSIMTYNMTYSMIYNL